MSLNCLWMLNWASFRNKSGLYKCLYTVCTYHPLRGWACFVRENTLTTAIIDNSISFHTHTHTQKAAPPTLRRDQSAIQTRSGYTHHSPNTHHSVLHMSSAHQPIALQGEFHVSLYGHVHPELCISANVCGCAGTVVFKRHQRPKCKIKRKRGGNV